MGLHGENKIKKAN